MLQPADYIQIEQLIRRERLARDLQDWDGLAACYSQNSRVEVSWFSGTGRDFARASAAVATKLLSFHETGATVIVPGDGRALTDTGHVVHLVAELDGAEVDCIGHIRVRARAERHGGAWLMAGMRGLYVHDMIVPTNPARTPHVPAAGLERYRRSYRCLSHMIASLGIAPREDLPGVDRPKGVRALIAEEEAWLLG